jgi:hypothetical protein
MLPQPQKNIVIDTDRREREPALDYAFLRARGIELIQQFAGSNWSDFNLHDPGVTILEYLCYALTDVAYRTTFPIADILADQKGLIDRAQHFFFTKQEALSSNPVTANDYRKLLIDSIPELSNVWLEPVTTSYTATYSKGIYRVIIEPAADGESNNPVPHLIETVKRKLLEYRSIGEHFECFRVLQPQPVYIKAEVIIERNASPEGVLASIYEVLSQTVNPTVTFYSEAELVDKGDAIEDIYSGPSLEKGIIPDSSLKERIRELDPFMLVKAISGIKGVIGVRKLLVSPDNTNYTTKVLKFDEHSFPLVIINDLQPDITLYNDHFPLYIQKPDALKKEHTINKKGEAGPVQQKAEESLRGEYKSLQDYISIQTLFPAIYGIHEEGIPASKPPAAVAQSRQLKAYLMFFEQLLANSLSQLANIGQLFSTDLSANSATYHYQPLYSVPDAKYILKAFTDESPAVSSLDWEHFKSDPDNGYLRAMGTFMETDEQYKDRKKRVFDHILARFNIALHSHPVYLYAFYYDKENEEKRIDVELKWKATILQNLSVFTSNRVKADNYFSLQEDESMENGFGKKMTLLLHIKNNTRRRLSEVMGQLSKQVLVAEHVVENDPAGERIVIHPNEEEPDILPDANEHLLTGHITFKGQTERLFQSAIEENNYKVLPARSEGETWVLFKHPADKKWSRVSKHADEYEAMEALKNTIRFFKEVSIESEGFYVLEHLLLKPSLEAQQYGFKFADAANNGLVQQSEWQSFAKREATIKELLAIGAAAATDNDSTTANRLQDLCFFYNNALTLSQQPGRQPAFMRPDKDAIAHFINNLAQFARRPTDFYPSFEYTVQLADGTEIAEDFFNFRMTIVFPSWPARFQDKSFRELAEAMFREECPAHLKVSFLWLSLSQMKVFDALYFNWLQAIRTDADSALTQTLSQELIRFLLANGAPWHQST